MKHCVLSMRTGVPTASPACAQQDEHMACVVKPPGIQCQGTGASHSTGTGQP